MASDEIAASGLAKRTSEWDLYDRSGVGGGSRVLHMYWYTYVLRSEMKRKATRVVRRTFMLLFYPGHGRSRRSGTCSKFCSSKPDLPKRQFWVRLSADGTGAAASMGLVKLALSRPDHRL